MNTSRMMATRVLNINDTETSRYALTRILTHAGFEVIEADAGLSGIEAAQNSQPAIILLDIKLPDLDGFEVCKRLKADPRTAPIPILHVTAHALGAESKVRSLEDGADAYLTFPADRTYLVAMTHSLIRLARVEAERENILKDLRGRNGELSAALEELKSEKALREKFVAMLSHDLRNPLATIKLSSEMAKRNVGNPQVISPLLDRILATTNRLDQMIQDLLDASVLHAGHELPLLLRPTDLRQLVSDTLEEFSARFGNRFVLNAPQAIVGATWDPRALRRALENLLQNAIKYGAPNDAITISLHFHDDLVRVTVHNWGNPIGDETRARLFQLYTRAPSAKSESGWGVGLAIVRGVVDAHRGRIHVESSQASGTSFVIDLPYAAAPEAGLRTDIGENSKKRGSIEYA